MPAPASRSPADPCLSADSTCQHTPAHHNHPFACRLQLPLAEQILECVAALTKSSRMIRRMGRNLGVMDPTVGTQPEILDDLIDGWAAVAHSGQAVVQT